MRRFLALMLAMMLALSVNFALAEDTLSDDIVILHTNDIHTYIDKAISYDVIAGVKAELQKQYKHVLLVDAGDHLQGTAYGSMDNGKSIVSLMNAAKYDVATLGNHEFDYGMLTALNVAENLSEYTYVSCNFYNEKDGVRGENVLKSYVTFDFGTEKVAILGITTPETFTKSTPAYFQNEKGEYIYGIAGGTDGAALYADVQKAIDDAKAEGATKVIALGHLGTDESSKPWTSLETIANVTGLDAFIDGHSHTLIAAEVEDKAGNKVVLSQTGEYVGTIGMLVIDAETGAISPKYIVAEDVMDGETKVGTVLKTQVYSSEEEKLVAEETATFTSETLPSDDAVATIKADWLKKVDDELGVKIGSTALGFDNYVDGNRIVRSQETNTGDFCADALYYLFDETYKLDVDVAIMNGGGIRNKTAVTGELTYKVTKDIHTFGNVACLQTVTGQQLLDALEWGAKDAGTGENGGFLQVSGITYKINTAIPSGVQKDEKGLWIGGPTEYRVHDVKVYNKETGVYEDLDLTASYNMAGYNYTLRDMGDGFNMFAGAINVLDYVMEDYMVLANYVKGFEGGVVEAKNSPLLQKYAGLVLDYATVYGSGRIEVK